MPKRLPIFQFSGKYLYYAYANLQMLYYALKVDIVIREAEAGQ